MKATLTLVVLIIASFIPSTSTLAHSNHHRKKWGIGLGNSYISLKYGASPQSSIEVGGAFGSGISVHSLRLYRNFASRDKTTTFIELEGGIISA